MSPLEQRALALWRAREMQFPRHARRMQPDAMDMVSGAWAATINEARSEMETENETKAHRAAEGCPSLA